MMTLSFFAGVGALAVVEIVLMIVIARACAPLSFKSR
jgi:hypothetical protein